VGAHADDAGRLREPTPTLALGVLLHDVGKPPTFTIRERIRFDNHVEVGAKMRRDLPPPATSSHQMERSWSWLATICGSRIFPTCGAQPNCALCEWRDSRNIWNYTGGLPGEPRQLDELLSGEEDNRGNAP